MSRSQKGEKQTSALHRHMKEIQNQRAARLQNTEPRNVDQGQLKRLHGIVEKTVKDFIEADDALMLQSSNPERFFISLSQVAVLVVTLSATQSKLSVAFQGEGTIHEWRDWAVDEPDKVIQSAIEEGLLQWYKRLF
ncbi:hypothetical protein [Alicyclobacillus ferrooxydans]|uniref:Uncharacterized protein n=1 Tax=Alicyclobacillus ferrooxydans TaxID=471514 RepID=A0A0P9GTS3_9BACL|nr:hypothetical protein [Alicyclobacillus ferrooxydans]KPV44602.1 hypothetical protein AN477_06295 [Alicyclobacillus ferrooxydans]